MIIRNPNLGACTVDYKPLGDLGLSFRRSRLFSVINTAVKASTGSDLPVAPLPPPPPPEPVAVIPPPPPPAPAPAPAPAPVLPQAGSDTDMVQLSQDTAALKEYFDVGVYRNILDMLLTFEGVLKRYGQSIANELNCVQRQSRIQCGAVNGQPACTPPPGYGNGEIIYAGTVNTLQLATAIGYAASKIGPKNKDEAQIYAQQQIKAAGLSAGVPTGFFEVPDLLNLARTIEYEMNRVRLPVPHNFRQIANAIQGREYKICAKWWAQIPGLPSKPSLQQWKYGGVRTSYFQKFDEVFSARYINGIELLNVYKNLRNAISAMRTGIRKEIDAANLAKKVQEETIRAEQEALISRQAAEEQARQRELEILAEKKAAYERELAEAEKVRQEMAQARQELTAELEQLNAARETAATPVEVQAVEEKAAEVAEAVVQAAEIEQDMASNLATSAQAAQNLNYQMRNVQADLITQREQAMQAGIPTKKPVNLTPIILTAAAGFLLS